MKKGKLLLIAIFFIVLSSCAVSTDTFTGEKNRTTCKLITKDNVQTTFVLQHNGEEINEEIVHGEVAYLDYTIQKDTGLEEQEKIKNAVATRYPIPEKYEPIIWNVNFSDSYIYNGKIVAVRDMTLGDFAHIRGYENVIPLADVPEFLQLTPELINKDIMTYQDFIDHLVSYGFECK